MMDLVPLVQPHGDLIVRMALMRTLLGAAHILGNTPGEKGICMGFVE